MKYNFHLISKYNIDFETYALIPRNYLIVCFHFILLFFTNNCLIPLKFTGIEYSYRENVLCDSYVCTRQFFSVTKFTVEIYSASLLTE